MYPIKEAKIYWRYIVDPPPECESILLADEKGKVHFGWAGKFTHELYTECYCCEGIVLQPKFIYWANLPEAPHGP